MYNVLSDTEWLRLRLTPDVSPVYIPNPRWKKRFLKRADRRQTGPVQVRITGKVESFGVLLVYCGWQVQTSENPGILFLKAETAVSCPQAAVVRFTFKNFRFPDKISLSFVLPNKTSEHKRINTDGK
ncbi:hypothetical protein EWP40_14920 [Salmonella enterica]|nr:hypothetical protein [Salmonella enterica]